MLYGSNIVFGALGGQRMRRFRREGFKEKKTLVVAFVSSNISDFRTGKAERFFAEEVFAKRIYKVHSIVVSTVTGWLPFSLAEFIVVVGPVVCLVLLIRFIVHMVKDRENRFARALLGIINVACVAAVILFVYVIGCGVNYHRVSVADYRGITVRDSSKEELYGLCTELVEQASALREELVEYEDENGVFRLPESNRKLGKMAQDAYEKLSGDLTVLKGGIRHRNVLQVQKCFLPWKSPVYLPAGLWRPM